MRRLSPAGVMGGEESPPDINITPLIDVVFVILIAFILLAPLFDRDLVELADGGEGLKDLETLTNHSIQITVRRDNTILLNTQEVTLEELKTTLALKREGHSDEKPKLFHDKEARFGTYQEIKNILASLGYEELDVVLNQP